MSIPEGVTQVANEGELPKAVSSLPSELDAPETRPYVISFARYNEKMCEIECLSKNRPKKAIQVLKQIGTKVHGIADFQRHNIDRIPVTRAGEYKKLYSGLKDDIEIMEIKLQGDARIFYFDIETDKTMFIVALTENHLETDKVRR